MLLLMVSFSCHNLIHHGDVDVTISDNDDVLKFSSHFNRRHTARVQQYLNKRLGQTNINIKKNTEEAITMDDQSTLYIRSIPGGLEIKLNKLNSSEAVYEDVKQTFEGIKKIVVDEQ